LKLIESESGTVVIEAKVTGPSDIEVPAGTLVTPAGLDVQVYPDRVVIGGLTMGSNLFYGGSVSINSTSSTTRSTTSATSATSRLRPASNVSASTRPPTALPHGPHAKHSTSRRASVSARRWPEGGGAVESAGL
jgi:hypothetical protein